MTVVRLVREESIVDSSSGPAPPERLRDGLAERGIDLGGEIGRGATSVVYRGTDRRHARDVAVKVLAPAATPDGDPQPLLQEVRLAAGLQHPHILPIYDSGTIAGTPFYVMPYVEGESLRHHLAKGKLSVNEAVRIAIEVGDALRYAHSRGVVHRDIKPENILLEGGHAVVADFGVATRLPDGETSHEDQAVGTAAYISPEQASGEAVFDGRSDLYALACVLYEMLAGEPPFTGRTPRATIARRFLGPPVPVRQRRPEIPGGVAAVVDRALATDPADRFPSASDFVEALAKAQRMEGAGEPTHRWMRGAVVVPAVLAAALLAILAGDTTHRPPARLDPRRVAVAALSNETGDSALAPLGERVASWITDQLGRTRGIEVVTSAKVVPAQHDQHVAGTDVDDPARLRLLATETRAGTLVSGSYYRGRQGSVEFHVEITDANSGALLRAIGPVMSDADQERTAARLGHSVAATVDSLLLRPIKDGR